VFSASQHKEQQVFSASQHKKKAPLQGDGAEPIRRGYVLRTPLIAFWFHTPGRLGAFHPNATRVVDQLQRVKSVGLCGRR